MKKKGQIAMLLVCGVFLVISIATEQVIQKGDFIFPKVILGDLAIGGMSKEEALFAIRKKAADYNQKELVLTGLGEEEAVSYAELGICLNAEKSYQEAWRYGRTGPWLERIQQRLQPRKISYVFDFEEKKAKDLFNQLAPLAAREAVPAHIWVDENGAIQKSNSINGQWLNVEANLQKLAYFPFAGEEKEFPLLIEEIVTYPSSEDIDRWQIDGIISSYETKFNVAQKDRSHNLTLAAQAIDNTLVQPGEEFSFNTVVGPRSSAKGYRNAMVISNDNFVEQLGGGICQVSSTLYNAALLGGFDITERSAHSLLITYVPPGLDATVSYGALDFKFLNNRELPILIHTKVKNGILQVSLYGQKREEKEYRFVHKVLRTISPVTETITNPKLAAGKRMVKQKGSNGMEVAVFRQTIENGQVIEEERISTNIYHGNKTIIEVGPKAAKKQNSNITEKKDNP